MIGLKRQSDWYSSKAKQLNNHSSGMRATMLIPEFKRRIEINETKIKAFGRHRILREHREVEELFLNVNRTILIIATNVANAYISREGVNDGSQKKG